MDVNSIPTNPQTQSVCVIIAISAKKKTKAGNEFDRLVLCWLRLAHIASFPTSRTITGLQLSSLYWYVSIMHPACFVEKTGSQHGEVKE